MLLKSRSLSLLVICMVCCYVYGEFKILGGKFLCWHHSHVTYLSSVTAVRKGRD